MELWYTEEWTDNFRFSLKVKQHLYHEESPYQKIDVIDTYEFGRMLILDGLVMFSDRDEAHYHEMLTHVPMFTHPNPKNILVIGGGDGGTMRELLRHPEVEHIDLVEIDRLVVEKSIEYFPKIASEFDNPKLSVHYKDGIEFVKNPPMKYDIVLIDSTDPIGPAVGLYEKPFYEDVYDCLTDEGLICAQAESSLLTPERVKGMREKLLTIYNRVLIYISFIPSYPGGQWAFIIGSKKYHSPDDFREDDARSMKSEFNYYTPDIHRASFMLPAKFKRFLEEE